MRRANAPYWSVRQLVLVAGRSHSRSVWTRFAVAVRSLTSRSRYSVSTRRSAAWPVIGRTGGKDGSRAVMRAIATASTGSAWPGPLNPFPGGHQGRHLDDVQVPLEQVNGGRPAEVAGSFDAHPHHVVAGQRGQQSGVAAVLVRQLELPDDLSGVVDHGHGEGVLVRVNACEHPIFSIPSRYSAAVQSAGISRGCMAFPHTPIERQQPRRAAAWRHPLGEPRARPGNKG